VLAAIPVFGEAPAQRSSEEVRIATSSTGQPVFVQFRRRRYRRRYVIRRYRRPIVVRRWRHRGRSVSNR
jgi:hypothetical protein